MTTKEKAVESFCNGFLCSQAILLAHCEKYGMEKEIALKLGAGFGGGMGRTGSTCGAVTGAIAVIGLKEGTTSVEDKVSKEKTYQTVRKFVTRFEERYGSVICKELLGCNIGDPEGYEYARQKGLFENLCPKLVGGAVEILDEVLR